MNLEQIKAIDEEYYLHVYGERMPVCFVRGQGCTLYDTQGRAYTDFFAGIATNVLGYGYPPFIEAVKAQVDNLLHISGVYYIESQARLAQVLCQNSFADRAFFCSTGAEANEGAVKLARKFFYKRGEKRYKVITLEGSFHGRTLAMVAATGQAKYQQPYHPLPAGFVQVPAYDYDALAAACDDETAAVLIELIQGEGGIHPASMEYVRAVRELCTKKGILMMVDEVQTGFGRTGTLFAYQQYGIAPDVMTLAKALGGGIPIGAILAAGDAAEAFSPGDHGTTFGGNPLATTAGLAVMRALLDDGILEGVAEKGVYLADLMNGLASRSSRITAVRARGLMVGVALSEITQAKQVAIALLERGFVVGTAAGNTLRLVPPLIITKADMDALAGQLAELLCV